MPIAANDILTVAVSLCSGPAEPEWRSAISRAYYAAYHHAEAWHRSLPLPGHNVGPAGGVHQQLINVLRNPDASIAADVQRRSKMLAAKLEVCKTRRRVADYQLGDALPKSEAEVQLAQADGILKSY